MPVIEIDSESTFNRMIKEKPCVVDFFATWCGPCQQIAPKFASLSSQYPNIHFLKVDVDKHQDLSHRYNVEALPSFVFFANGSKVDFLRGASDVENVIKNFAAKYGKPVVPVGPGHVLGSSGAGAGATSGAGARPGNPWAQPGWFPGKN